jgi:DNA adenine methylase
VKPIVKWAGGKSKLLPELLARVPQSIDTYVEPFAGGAALFFALAAGKGEPGAPSFRCAILADKNEDLVACYRAVRDRVESVIRALGPYKYDRDLYYRAREQDPRSLDDVARAARLIFLNRTCYNGLWRVNSKGKFNVPFGRYKNPTILDPEGLRIASKLLSGVDVRVSDFESVTSGLGPRDFVYFDPPYVPVSKTADFTAYSSDKFDAAEQNRLRDRMRELKKRGVPVLLSNADTEQTRELYREFCVERVLMRRNINRDAKKRGDIAELLVTTIKAPARSSRRAAS